MTGQDREFRHALRGAQDGDVAAFEALWRRSGPRLDRYLYITAPHRAEAVATRTWATVAAGLRAFRGDAAAFLNVLVRVARAEAEDLRRGLARGVGGGRVLELVDPLPEPGRGVVRRRPGAAAGAARGAGSAAAVAGLLAGLTADVAELVALRVVGGFAARETAGLLCTRSGFVIVGVHSGLRRAAAAVYPAATGVAFPDPWQLDRLLDRVVVAAESTSSPEPVLLHPSLRRLVTALTAPGPAGDPAQLASARLVLEQVGRPSGVPVTGLDVLSAAGGPYVRPQRTF